MAAGLTFQVFGQDVSATKTLKKVEGESNTASKTIGGHFKKLGTVIGGAFAAVGVASFFKGAFDEATEAQKVGAQTAAVLKSTGDAANITAKQVGDLATVISNKVGIDDEAIQSGENMLLTFRNLRNETGKGNDVFNQATKTLVDMSVATGKDMKTSAVSLGKALNDPIKGITALSRVGVTFSAQQKEQIKNFVATGNTMAAQKVILRELNSEFAGSAEAQATPAEKAKVAWANLQEQIGTKLLPVIATLASFLAERVIPVLSSLFDWIGKNKDWLIPLAAAIGGVIVVLKSWAIAQALINTLLALNPIVLIIAALVALGVAMVVLWKKSETFRDIVKGVFDVLRTAVQIWWDVHKAAFDAVISAVRQVGSAFVAVGGAIKDAFGSAAGFVKDKISDIVGFVTGLPRRIADLADNMLRAGSGLISSLFRGIRNALSGAGNLAADIGRDIVNAIIDGLNAILPHHLHVGMPWPVPDINVPLIPSIPHIAQGTGFFRGGVALMGENGRELANLPAGSKVSSNTVTESQMRMGGSGEVTVNVNLNGISTAPDVARAVAQGLEIAVNRLGIRIAGVTG